MFKSRSSSINKAGFFKYDIYEHNKESQKDILILFGFIPILQLLLLFQYLDNNSVTKILYSLSIKGRPLSKTFTLYAFVRPYKAAETCRSKI